MYAITNRVDFFSFFFLLPPSTDGGWPVLRNVPGQPISGLSDLPHPSISKGNWKKGCDAPPMSTLVMLLFSLNHFFVQISPDLGSTQWMTSILSETLALRYLSSCTIVTIPSYIGRSNTTLHHNCTSERAPAAGRLYPSLSHRHLPKWNRSSTPRLCRGRYFLSALKQVRGEARTRVCP